VTSSPHRIGLIGFDHIQGLDLLGPMDAFAAANELSPDGGGCYEIAVIGETARPFRTSSGLQVTPDYTAENAPDCDTLIVPGGLGGRQPETMRWLVPWLAKRAPEARRVASVCTGIYPLAATGLLDGRKVTTHWSHAAAVARRFPRLKVNGNAIFIKENRFYTSAGVTAGIDLSLALIEEDFGGRLALSVARELVVYLKRPGGQEQYSEPLKFQTGATDRLGELVTWMSGHLTEDLTIEALAEWVCLSPRQFSRRFKTAYGCTPADFVEDLRLSAARHRLGEPGMTIDSIAASVGFKSADVFRRVFERRLGVTPSLYRYQFPGARGQPQAA
jgi:transcriptional regulator GlxA family with amidase domain